jgi:hypothetical protein
MMPVERLLSFGACSTTSDHFIRDIHLIVGEVIGAGAAVSHKPQYGMTAPRDGSKILLWARVHNHADATSSVIADILLHRRELALGVE